jgi:heme exporter protein C
MSRAMLVSGAVAAGLWLLGMAVGLVLSPAEQHMSDLVRIMFVHVPVAWAAMATFTVALVASVGWLATRRWGWDHLLDASLEVGVLLGILLSFQGAVWGYPTWGTWWTWDPRLTSVAVMVLSFLGILALRSFVDDPEKRASWSAAASILAWGSVPFTYFSVKVMNSLHQKQTPWGAMDPDMLKALLVNTATVSLLTAWMLAARYQVARAELRREMDP